MTQTDLAPTPPAAPGPARLWRLRTVAAAAITAVALAGAGGAALAVAADSVGTSGPGGQVGRPFPGGGPMGNQPPTHQWRPGQVPPSTAPSTGSNGSDT
jgi:hypothetical protein